MLNPFIRIIYQIPEPSQDVRNRSFSTTDRTGYRRKYHNFSLRKSYTHLETKLCITILFKKSLTNNHRYAKI